MIKQGARFLHMDPRELIRLVALDKDDNEAMEMACIRFDTTLAKATSPQMWPHALDELVELYEAIYRTPGALERIGEFLRERGLLFNALQRVKHPRLGEGRVLRPLQDGQLKVRFEEGNGRSEVIYPFALTAA